VPRQPPPALIPRYWSPGWNSVQAINKFQIEGGGPLHGGDPGRRLIEPTVVIGPRVEIGPSVTLGASAPSEASDCSGTAQLKSTADFFQPVSPSGTAANGAAVAPTISERTVDGNPWRTVDGNSWLIVPAWHIFGSEELSARSPAIASLVPLPYVAIGAADAARLGVTDGEQVLLSIVAAPGATAAPFAAVPQESPDATSEPDTTASLSASVSGQAHKLVLRIHDKLPAGVATMAVGLPGAPAVDLPAWGEITPAAASDKAPADSHEDDA
jgi:NADH-quinone oxidoreductase subunit G